MWEDDRPKELEVAYWLWIAIPVVSLLRVIIVFAAGLGGIDVSNVDTPSFADVAILLFALVVVAIQFTVPSLMWRAKNWARVTLTVFAVGGLLGTLSGQARTPLPWWVTLPELLLYVAAVVMSYRPAVNAWFRVWA